MNVNCDKSPDGRHEVKINWLSDRPLLMRCLYCNEPMEDKDAICLINAALQLTAEEAWKTINAVADLGKEVGMSVKPDDPLVNYARWRAGGE